MTIEPARQVSQRRWLPARSASKKKVVLLVATGLLATVALAQGTPKVTKVDPPAGKVNDTLTVAGEALGKGSVAAIFLSDDKSDYKATIISQEADKIVMKVPQVKPGGYNVSIQVGSGILIEPVRFTVQE
jgi:IPT/TIG domain-containing protein